MAKENEKRWNTAASKLLNGRTILSAQYMSEADAEKLGWSSRPVVLILDDGQVIAPSCDDEGNNGGALFIGDEVLPVL